MAEADPADYKSDCATCDRLISILVREILTFEQLKGLVRNQTVRFLRTRKGHVLKLQGQADDQFSVELEYGQTKTPRFFQCFLTDFQDFPSKLEFSVDGEILPAVVDVSD